MNDLYKTMKNRNYELFYKNYLNILLQNIITHIIR